MKTWELYVWRIFWDEMLKNLRWQSRTWEELGGLAEMSCWDVMRDTGRVVGESNPKKSQETYDWVTKI